MYPTLPSSDIHINEAADAAYPPTADEWEQTGGDGDAPVGERFIDKGVQVNTCCDRCIKCGTVISSSRLTADILLFCVIVCFGVSIAKNLANTLV